MKNSIHSAMLCERKIGCKPRGKVIRVENRHSILRIEIVSNERS